MNRAHIMSCIREGERMRREELMESRASPGIAITGIPTRMVHKTEAHNHPEIAGRNIMEIEENSINGERGYQQFVKLQERVCRVMDSQFPAESGEVVLFDYAFCLHYDRGELYN